MSIKLGSKNIILPYSKAYLGSKLVYQKSGYEDIEFTECPFPTSWNAVTTGTEYTATNDYGEWRIWADSVYDNFPIPNAFDGNTNSFYESGSLSSNANYYIGIDLPDGVLIKTTNIYIVHRYMHPGSSGLLTYIQGLNENGEWETLAYISLSTEKTTENFNIDTDSYYSKFRVKMRQYSSSYTRNYIYEFQITSGTIRKII